MDKHYRASIKKITTSSWLKSITINSYTHTLIASERRIFKDKKKAEKIFNILQEKYPDTFTLVVET